jgi:hypothetical protein
MQIGLSVEFRRGSFCEPKIFRLADFFAGQSRGRDRSSRLGLRFFPPASLWSNHGRSGQVGPSAGLRRPLVSRSAEPAGGEAVRE